jgi:hypothetical protein
VTRRLTRPAGALGGAFGGSPSTYRIYTDAVLGTAVRTRSQTGARQANQVPA